MPAGRSRDQAGLSAHRGDLRHGTDLEVSSCCGQKHHPQVCCKILYRHEAPTGFTPHICTIGPVEPTRTYKPTARPGRHEKMCLICRRTGTIWALLSMSRLSRSLRSLGAFTP